MYCRSRKARRSTLNPYQGQGLGHCNTLPSSIMMEFAILLVALVAVTTVVLLLRGASVRTPLLKLPPGPTQLPLLGNLGILLVSKNLPRDLIKLSKQYGPIVWLQLGSRGAAVVSSSELAREVLKEQGQVFASRPFNYASAQLTCDAQDVGVAPYGPLQTHQRKLLASQLLYPIMTAKSEDARMAEVNFMVEAVRQHILKAKPNKPKPVDLGLLFRILTLNNIMRIGTNQALVTYDNITGESTTKDSAGAKGTDAERFYSMMKDYGMCFSLPMLGDYIPWLSFVDVLNGNKSRVKHVRRRLDVYVGRVIQEHKEKASSESAQGKDYVDVLLRLNQPDKLIQAQILDLIVAGTDTISTTLEWTFTEILRRPAVYKRVRQELLSVVGPNRSVMESDLPHLPYIDAIVKETLRMYPSVPLLLPHMSISDTKLAGYHIPANTTIFINALAIGRDPSLWTDPDEFLPERWLNSNQDVNVLGLGKGPLKMVPFGTGRRSCIGAEYSLRLMPLSIARLLQSFTWALPDDAQEIDVLENPGVFLSRRHPVRGVPSLPS